MKVETFQYTEVAGWGNSLRRASYLDSKNTVLFVFGACPFGGRRDLFTELDQYFPRSVKVGCSGAGEVFGSRLFDDILSVAVVAFEKTRVRIFSKEIPVREQSFAVGKDIAQQLSEFDLAGVFILSDGTLINGSELVRGLNSLSPEVVITGGLAGCQNLGSATWVISNGRPESGVVTALGLYGTKLRMDHGSWGGWDIFGPECTITKSRHNILYELDEKPALETYKEYLGEMASDLPGAALWFPLQIRMNDGNAKRIVRTVLSIDESERAMVFAGDMPAGSLAQMMMADLDRLIDGATRAAGQVCQAQVGSAPSLSIAISCAGRRLVLGERTCEEIEAISSLIGTDGKQVGFYANGEISPTEKGGRSELHNQTMTITRFSEEGAHGE